MAIMAPKKTPKTQTKQSPEIYNKNLKRPSSDGLKRIDFPIFIPTKMKAAYIFESLAYLFVALELILIIILK